MFRNENGNVIFQILIVILFIGLLFTLLYPNKVWKEEAELTKVCQTRMETIRQMEFIYMSENQVFNDTIPMIVERALENPAFDTSLDTLVAWDNLVQKNELKNIVLGVDMPAALNSLIKKKISSGSTLAYLSEWDSLEDDLLNILKDKIASDSLGMIDTCVVWSNLVGTSSLYEIIKDAKMYDTRKREIRRAILNDDPLNKTRGWNVIQPIMIDTLDKMIALAQTEGTWTASQKSEWEDYALNKWEKEMNALPDSSKLKLWKENVDKFWDKERDIVWRKDRVRLWKQEGNEWIDSNEAVWKRILNQRWKLEIRKNWLEEKQASLPDSMQDTFKATKDSLWKVYFNKTEKQLAWEEEQKAGLSDSAVVVFESQKDSLWKPILEELQNEKFDSWLTDNKKDVDEVIEGLWESERMISWQSDAYDRWLEKREAKMEKTWEDLKEELWKTEQISLWQGEEKKLGLKQGAYRKIDFAVQWQKLLSQEDIDVIVDGLDLPDANGLWNEISKTNDDELGIVKLGVAGLFKKELLKDIAICPVAKVPYIVEINNQSRLKTIAVKCPIVDKEKNKYAISLNTIPVYDDSTNEMISTRVDTIKSDINLSAFKKIFGGAKIKSHGSIDRDGKNSWDKPGQ